MVLHQHAKKIQAEQDNSRNRRKVLERKREEKEQAKVDEVSQGEDSQLDDCPSQESGKVTTTLFIRDELIKSVGHKSREKTGCPCGSNVIVEECVLHNLCDTVAGVCGICCGKLQMETVVSAAQTTINVQCIACKHEIFSQKPSSPIKYAT